MKQLILFAACLFAAVWAKADGITSIDDRPDEVTNLLVNGDFEDKGYRQSDVQVYDWTTEFTSYNADSIPGWHRRESIRNGCVAIAKHDDGSQYVHYQFNNTSGWTSFGLDQTVSNLVPGREYTLDLFVAHHFSNEEANITYGIEVHSNPTMADVTNIIAEAKGNLDAGDGNFGYYVLKFTAICDYAVIMLNGYNWGGQENNKNGNAWIRWDEVRLYDAIVPVGISSVAVDSEEPQAVYDLQGRRVAHPVPGRVYVSQGKKYVAKGCQP